MTEEQARPATTPDQVPGPVAQSERYTSLDTVRGVAVLGILIMNIYGFAMPFPAYMNPLIMGGTEWYNMGTWFVTHILADQKFMSIFSMLFGAGIVLMWERAQARNAKFGRIYYRRMFWLLVIGAIHGYLIWFGDILFSYAAVGMLLYAARKWKPRTLIIVACLMLPVASLMSVGSSYYMEQLKSNATNIAALQESGEEITDKQQAQLEEWETIGQFFSPSPEHVQQDLDAYRGSYGDIMEVRVPLVVSMQVNNMLFFMLWRVGGLMLLGMAMMKMGIFTGQREPATYKRMMLFGYGLGLPLLVYSAWILNAHDFDGLYFMRSGHLPNYVGSILIALGHIGLIVRLVQTGALAALMARFAAVGRMAFTNYLTHSIVLTTIFYGYGFGLYGEIPRAAQMLFVAAMLGFQLWLSPWWLARYRFGPAEWLWRSLTYWKRQPMRREASAA